MNIRRLRKFIGQTLPPVVSVLRLSGVIGAMGSLRQGLSIATTASLIERAFAVPDQAAVALVINSPGGSPVQSALIGNRIRSLAVEKKVPVIAFVEDVAASGGYWLACAADEIIADANSIVGSIGVISAGFGFHDLIGRIGVERRLHASGERKGMLDPFSPERPEDVARLKRIQEDIHESFRAWVRARRGEKLKAPESELFTGEFWTGTRGLELGLIDGIGDARGVLRARFGEKVVLRPVGARRPWLSRRLGFTGSAVMAGEGVAHGIAAGLLAAAEERAWWGRYGL